MRAIRYARAGWIELDNYDGAAFELGERADRET